MWEGGRQRGRVRVDSEGREVREPAGTSKEKVLDTSTKLSRKNFKDRRVSTGPCFLDDLCFGRER